MKFHIRVWTCQTYLQLLMHYDRTNHSCVKCHTRGVKLSASFRSFNGRDQIVKISHHGCERISYSASIWTFNSEITVMDIFTFVVWKCQVQLKDSTQEITVVRSFTHECESIKFNSKLQPRKSQQWKLSHPRCNHV